MSNSSRYEFLLPLKLSVFQSAEVGDQRLDIRITEFFGKGGHFTFEALFDDGGNPGVALGEVVIYVILFDWCARHRRLRDRIAFSIGQAVLDRANELLGAVRFGDEFQSVQEGWVLAAFARAVAGSVHHF